MIKRLTLAATMAATFATTSTPSFAGVDDLLGEIVTVGYSFCPRGYIEADGRLLPISKNAALFSLFGTNFGGDGRASFGLPDMMSDAKAGERYCVNLLGLYPSRD